MLLRRDGTVTFEKKPLWQRLGASTFVVLGSGCAILALLLSRRRNVRRIDILRKQKQFYLETSADRPGAGKLLDQTACIIAPNRRKHDLASPVMFLMIVTDGTLC